jgi:hypothetical protein
MHIRSAALLSLAGAAAASAQCTSAWDTAIGNPGASSGYAAAVASFDDGSGPQIYLGGSFTSVGGLAAARYLGRYNPATNLWSMVGGGINPNNTTFITSILPANLGSGQRLYVGGAFGNAGGVANTRSLASFANGQWQSLGTNWPLNTADSVSAMTTWDPGTGTRLYVGGKFTTVGGITGNCIAAYDGTAWHALGTGVTGNDPTVQAMKVFDDGTGPALYILGRFISVGGVPGTSIIARWNGEAWSSVGGGLTSTSSLFAPEAMTVWNDGSGAKLYVAGYTFIASGNPATNVAAWNRTSWAAVGGVIGTGRLTSIVPFNDGTGETLYIGGTAMPQIGYFAKLVNGAWVTVGGGITAGQSGGFPSVFGLAAIDSKLYVAGSYSQVGGSLPANDIAIRTSCGQPGGCYANCDSSTTTPVLNVADFTCFLQRYAAGESYANCDNSTTPPTLNVADFTCFLQRYAAGCP